MIEDVVSHRIKGEGPDGYRQAIEWLTPRKLHDRLSDRMAEMVSTNQFKNGMHIDVEGTVFRIVEFQHVKPGKGGAFVRTKLKAFESGAVIDRTFRAGEKFPRIITSYDDVQYLYEDGDRRRADGRRDVRAGAPAKDKGGRGAAAA